MLASALLLAPLAVLPATALQQAPGLQQEEVLPPGLPLVEDVDYVDHGLSWEDGFCASRDNQSPINLDKHQLGAGIRVG